MPDPTRGAAVNEERPRRARAGLALAPLLAVCVLVHRYGCWTRRHARVSIAHRVRPLPAAGLASGTADLQRDLGGAISQSILGAVLMAGYAAVMSSAIGASAGSQQVTSVFPVRTRSNNYWPLTRLAGLPATAAGR
jgi:hypothetical protein